jgi:hypothetical protein
MYRKSAGLGALLTVGTVFVAGNANATAVSATAQLFELSQINGPTLTLSNNYFTQDAQTSVLGDTFATGASAQNISVGSNPGAISNLDPSTSAPFTKAFTSVSGSASSLFQWSFDYSAASTGTVMLDFDYNYAAQIVNFTSGDKAGASSRIDVLRDGVPLSEVERFYFVSNQNGDASGEDHVFMTFDVISGQMGTITFTASSQAFVSSVPLPAGIWLLSSVLGALGFVRRRVA